MAPDKSLAAEIEAVTERERTRLVAWLERYALSSGGRIDREITTDALMTDFIAPLIAEAETLRSDVSNLQNDCADEVAARRAEFDRHAAEIAALQSRAFEDGARCAVVPLEPTEAMLNAPLAPGSSITGARYESRRDLRPLIYAAMISARPSASAENAKDKALRDIAQQDRGGLQGVYEDGGDADAAVKYLLGQVERRRKIAREALAARPAAPEAQGVADGWLRKAADEIDKIADLWSGEGRAYGKTLAAVFRADADRGAMAAHPAKQSEPAILCAVVEVFADRTDTRLTFGGRIRPEPAVKAVEQAIAALTAEYEARGGCPALRSALVARPETRGAWQDISGLAVKQRAVLGRWCRCGDAEDGSEHWYWQRGAGFFFEHLGERHWSLDSGTFEGAPFYGSEPTHFLAVPPPPDRPAPPASSGQEG